MKKNNNQIKIKVEVANLKDLVLYYEAKDAKLMNEETFKKGQRAKMLRSLEIGIYKSISVDPTDGLLRGEPNGDFNDYEALEKTFKNDKLATRIIKEKIEDDQAIDEALSTELY